MTNSNLGTHLQRYELENEAETHLRQYQLETLKRVVIVYYR